MRRCSQLILRLRILASAGFLFALCFFASSSIAQTSGPLSLHRMDPNETDQEAPPEISSRLTLPDSIKSPSGGSEPEPARPELPARVTIPTDHPIRVTLDTPLSTRISKPGQIVTFRTTYSILLGDSLEVPPDTEIMGHVVQVKKPGTFGKQGVLRVAVDRIQLTPDGGTDVKAHIDSAEMKGQGRTQTDRRKASDIYSVVIDAAGGTILGGALGGAKGAGIGAGAGAATALLIMMSHHGQDVYLEPGMPFSVMLDEPAYLSGEAVYAAQENFRKHPRPPTVEPDLRSSQPKLKRRRPPLD